MIHEGYFSNSLLISRYSYISVITYTKSSPFMISDIAWSIKFISSVTSLVIYFTIILSNNRKNESLTRTILKHHMYLNGDLRMFSTYTNGDLRIFSTYMNGDLRMFGTYTNGDLRIFCVHLHSNSSHNRKCEVINIHY